MRWWYSKPQPVTAKSLDSASYLDYTFTLSRPTHNFSTISGSSIPFLPLPRPIPYRPPSSTRQHLLYIYLHPILPPSLLPGRGATSHLDRGPTRQPPLLVCASLPCREAQTSSFPVCNLICFSVPSSYCPVSFCE